MTITASDIKIGMCIEMDNKTFLVVDFQHCKPGKGPAFVRSKLKNLENGYVLEKTFSSVSQKIEQVRVERRPYQFTYEDDLGAHFMHTETFEEITTISLNNELLSVLFIINYQAATLRLRKIYILILFRNHMSRSMIQFKFHICQNIYNVFMKKEMFKTSPHHFLNL